MKEKANGERTVTLHFRAEPFVKKSLEETSERLGVTVSTLVRIILMNATRNGGFHVSMNGGNANSINNATNSTITQTIGK